MHQQQQPHLSPWVSLQRWLGLLRSLRSLLLLPWQQRRQLRQAQRRAQRRRLTLLLPLLQPVTRQARQARRPLRQRRR